MCKYLLDGVELLISCVIEVLLSNRAWTNAKSVDVVEKE